MLFLAGMAGFEPTNARVKVWCLTAWRHPKIHPVIITESGRIVKSVLIFVEILEICAFLCYNIMV